VTQKQIAEFGLGSRQRVARLPRKLEDHACKLKLKAPRHQCFRPLDIVSNPMKLFREEQRILGCFSILLLLSGCGGAEPECDSLDTRNSIIKIVSDDDNNALVNYAVKNSSSVAAMVNYAKSEADKLAIFEKARRGAAYRLDETIRMKSRNRAARAVTCIGLLYVTVADTTAQKEIEFKVEQTTDGKMSVSVSPFLF
jgi:hypothetical protein